MGKLRELCKIDGKIEKMETRENRKEGKEQKSNCPSSLSVSGAIPRRRVLVLRLKRGSTPEHFPISAEFRMGRIDSLPFLEDRLNGLHLAGGNLGCC